ncbi:hypothetical protein GALMADRAFT_229753 [Galerina marginata CBS 339.88]|uniref:Uncharacterized protein n=1 Tax=Galerina marginata (strain CBS 339.88) TaxID=685588 RepID=A0A067STT2_GALM3|nr:hypothetical protein GALMADRAFT_229753 [Galerina marginata CBS 339.88]
MCWSRSRNPKSKLRADGTGGVDKVQEGEGEDELGQLVESTINLNAPLLDPESALKATSDDRRRTTSSRIRRFCCLTLDKLPGSLKDGSASATGHVR